jgi:hypothetical protein
VGFTGVKSSAVAAKTNQKSIARSFFQVGVSTRPWSTSGWLSAQFDTQLTHLLLEKHVLPPGEVIDARF